MNISVKAILSLIRLFVAKLYLLILLFTTNMIVAESNIHAEDGVYYVHEKRESFKSRFLKSGLKILNMKDNIEKSFKNNNFMHTADKIPRSLSRNFIITEEVVSKRNVWTINPKDQESNIYIFYLHGGAYIHNVSKLHWIFLESLAKKTNAVIVVPDYPLAPEASYLEAYAMIEEVYKKLLKETDSANILFMGDSAGGGLALAFAQKLRDEGKPQPDRIILLSPWLDITMENPEIKDVDKKDLILSIRGLQLAGDAFANGDDPTSYMLSPVYGEFHELGEISLFIGTHDLFYPDCQKLKEILEEQGIPFTYYEYPKMIHVWMIMTGLRESRFAIEQITKLVSGG